VAATAPPRSDTARLLPAAYAIFALAATGRSAVQLATHASEAPVPYALSALAGLVYIAGFIALWKAHSRPRVRYIATALCLFELAGVVGVGLFSVLAPTHFRDDTVWSRFGSGYGFIPVVLPLAALWWLRMEERRAKARQHAHRAPIPDTDSRYRAATASEHPGPFLAR
jgi:hypothetical protein